MDKKRIILLVLFVATTLFLGWLLYRVFFAPDKPIPTTPTTQIDSTTGLLPGSGLTDSERQTTGPSGGLPTTPDASINIIPGLSSDEARIRQAVTTETLGENVDAQGNLTFYNQDDGLFYRILPDGTIEQLSEQRFFNVEEVTWSPTEATAIIEYPDGANIYFNFSNNQQVSLPKDWEEFSFSTQGDRIAAKNISLSKESRWIVSSNPDGSNIQLVEPLGNNASKVDINWSPNNQIIGMSRTGASVGVERQEVLFVGLNGENFKSTIVEGQGFQSQWSPSGDKLLYSVFSRRSEFKPELWIVNANGNNIGTGKKQLGINTWSEKCAFGSENIIYCAVPISLELGVGFEPELAANTPDQLIKINLSTNQREIIPLDNTFNITKITIREDSNTLYFSDRFKIGVFSVDL